MIGETANGTVGLKLSVNFNNSEAKWVTLTKFKLSNDPSFIPTFFSETGSNDTAYYIMSGYTQKMYSNGEFFLRNTSEISLT